MKTAADSKMESAAVFTFRQQMQRHREEFAFLRFASFRSVRLVAAAISAIIQIS